MQKDGLGKYYVFAFRVATDMTATIMVPAVLAALGGRYLDGRFGTGRAFFIALLACSALVAVWGVVTKARKYGEAFKKLVGEPGNGSARR